MYKVIDLGLEPPATTEEIATKIKQPFILEGMAGMNGFALPPRDNASLQQVAAFPILFDLGWAYDPFHVLVGGLGVLLLVAWFAPNTQQLMDGYDRAIRPYREGAAGQLAWPFQWRPTLPMAFLVGLVFFVSVLGLITDVPSPFVYFQF